MLARIADAVERLGRSLPGASPEPADWLAFPAYVWVGGRARGLPRLSAPALAMLRGIDAQKAAVVSNIDRHAAGHAAHDMLLWGARGMGKSALPRAAVIAAQDAAPRALALVQVPQDALADMTGLFAALAAVPTRRFVVFIDDLGFAEGDDTTPRLLRSWLEGGIEARPANVRLAVTANRRAIVSRHAGEQDDPLNPRDAIDDRLALADRFGLSIGFHVCDQADYLAIVEGYAAAMGLAWDRPEALEWSRRRGGRSGRVAWQFVTELAGRAGRPADHVPAACAD